MWCSPGDDKKPSMRPRPFLRVAKAIRWAVSTDVTDPAAVRDLFAQTERTFGRLDVLFNNAGVGIPAGEIDEVTYDQWQRVVQTNLSGPFFCTQEAFRLMKLQSPQGGRIINNGSLSAHVPRPNSAPYTSTKHGITGLTKSTSLDGRKYNIACGQIDIGNAATDMALKIGEGATQADGSVRPEPLMDLSVVAEAVLYMANLPLGGKRSVHDGDGHKNAFCRARIIGRSQNPGVRRCWVRQTMGEERSPVQGIARNNDHESCQSGLLSPDYLTAFRPSEFPSQHLLTPGFWLLAPFLKRAEARPREIPACHQRRIVENLHLHMQ